MISHVIYFNVIGVNWMTIISISDTVCTGKTWMDWEGEKIIRRKLYSRV